VVSLRAVRNNMYRADRAARVQMNAAPPVDPDDEGGEDAVTTGPDSVVAVLTLDQTIVMSLAGLFDTHSQGVVVSLTHTLFQTMSARDKLLASVIALDPEGAGADYADGMADTLDGYSDEVANLQEALNSDALSAGGRKVLTAALAKSQATLAAITAAFGGGEDHPARHDRASVCSGRHADRLGRVEVSGCRTTGRQSCRASTPVTPIPVRDARAGSASVDRSATGRPSPIRRPDAEL
jgi:hypothetical protein